MPCRKQSRNRRICYIIAGLRANSARRVEFQGSQGGRWGADNGYPDSTGCWGHLCQQPCTQRYKRSLKFTAASYSHTGRLVAATNLNNGNSYV